MQKQPKKGLTTKQLLPVLSRALPELHFQEVDSSNIWLYAYDEINLKFWIIFRTTNTEQITIYVHEGVAPFLLDKWLASASKGKGYNELIRPITFQKVGLQLVIPHGKNS